MHGITDIATALGAVVTAGMAIWAAIRVIPFLRSQAVLIVERDNALKQAAMAQATADAWKERFDSLDGRLQELRDEFMEKVDRLEHKLAISVRYIAMLSMWAHERRKTDPIPMPQPPEELREDIETALREQSDIARDLSGDHQI